MNTYRVVDAQGESHDLQGTRVEDDEGVIRILDGDELVGRFVAATSVSKVE